MNVSIDKEDNSARVVLDAKIYPKDVVYSAAYVFIDRAYVILEGDPEKHITVGLKPKAGSGNPEEIALEFQNELLNYLVYKNRVEKAGPLRNIIVQRALLTNLEQSVEELTAVPGGIIEEWEEDPEGISTPWNEKHGKKKR